MTLKTHTSHKVSINDVNHLLILGSNNVNVPNGVENAFQVQGIPINLLSICHAC